MGINVIRQTSNKMIFAIIALALLSVSILTVILPSKASAQYATVTNINGYTVQVCKLSGPYGYTLRTVASKPAASTAILNVNTSGPPPGSAGSPKAHTASSQWYWGVVTTTDTYAGDDSWSFMTTVTHGSDYHRYGWVLMAYVPWC